MFIHTNLHLELLLFLLSFLLAYLNSKRVNIDNDDDWICLYSVEFFFFLCFEKNHITATNGCKWINTTVCISSSFNFVYIQNLMYVRLFVVIQKCWCHTVVAYYRLFEGITSSCVFILLDSVLFDFSAVWMKKRVQQPVLYICSSYTLALVEDYN